MRQLLGCPEQIYSHRKRGCCTGHNTSSCSDVCSGPRRNLPERADKSLPIYHGSESGGEASDVGFRGTGSLFCGLKHDVTAFKQLGQHFWEFGLTSQKAENYKPPNGGKCCRGANEKMPTVSKTAPNSGTLNILEPGQGFGDHYPKPYKS